jgi:hypothetical protein
MRPGSKNAGRFCIGENKKVDQRIAKQSGIAEFIYKPVDEKRLIQRMLELCPIQPA